MYIIEGNIGAGKTTFLNLIGSQIPHVTIVDEPLDSWNNKEQGESLLANFYKDTPRWAFTMEMFTLMCRIREHAREQKNIDDLIVMERSIYSGYYCFALNSYKQGFMSNLEWEIHKRWFDYLVKNKCTHPQGFIYLKTDPKVSYKRTKKRNRSGEETIPLEYFQQINERLEQFLLKKQGLLPGLSDVPVLTLNCDQEFAQDSTRQKELLDKLSEFFAQNQTFVPARKEKTVESFGK